MVFVNGQKYACEACIKGHRSSHCGHNERPLFEVKRKGRPVSQCETCRHLRKTKNAHNRCKCNDPPGPSTSAVPQLPPGAKKPRFRPIAPALPNGLRDIAPQYPSPLSSNPKQRVDGLLNPCRCGDIHDCRCDLSRSSSASAPATVSRAMQGLISAAAQEVDRDHGLSLASLAHAAALCCTVDTTMADARQPAPKRSAARRSPTPPPVPSCCSAKPSPQHDREERAKKPKHKHTPSATSVPVTLPPLLSTTTTSASSSPWDPTGFPFRLPQLSSIASIAGSGCQCGFACVCPGCAKHSHRAPGSPDDDDDDDDADEEETTTTATAALRNGSKNAADSCAEDCMTCVDHESGIALSLPPATFDASASTSTSIIDEFFAHAAALPPPPPPQPLDSLSPPAPVRLPKLQCCKGRCRCAEGRCACGDACDGSCAGRDKDAESMGRRRSCCS